MRTLKGHAHRINTLALSCDYVCRTGPYDHRCAKFASAEEAYQAAVAKYEAFKSAGEPERLVSGSDDFTIYLWHPTENKHPIKRLTGHQQAVNHLAFSPDGRYLASGSFDKKVKIWSGKSGEFINTLTGHVGAVYQVAWSNDSRYLVSASKDSTAKLWEVPSCKRARETLPGHHDEVYALELDPRKVRFGLLEGWDREQDAFEDRAAYAFVSGPMYERHIDIGGQRFPLNGNSHCSMFVDTSTR